MEKSGFFRVEYALGPKLLARKFVKATEEQTIGDVLNANMPDGNDTAGDHSQTPSLCISRVTGYGPTAPKTCLDLTMPVPYLGEFGVKNVDVLLVVPTPGSQEVSSSGSKSAFDVLMSIQRKYDKLPDAR